MAGHQWGPPPGPDPYREPSGPPGVPDQPPYGSGSNQSGRQWPARPAESGGWVPGRPTQPQPPQPQYPGQAQQPQYPQQPPPQPQQPPPYADQPYPGRQPPPGGGQQPPPPAYPSQQPLPGQQPYPAYPGQQPPGQQPPGWGYDDDDDWGSPPAKRKRGAAPVVAIVLVGALIVAGVGGLGWYFMRQSNSTLADPLTSTSATNSATPRETPSTVRSPSPSPSPTTSDSPLPTGKAREQILKQNKLYSAGTLASVSCRESDSMPSSRAGVEKYYKSIIACLNRSWPSLVEKAGYQFREPKLVLWSGSVDTPCGDYVRAFYCPTNETIYMKWDDDVNQYNKYPEEYQKVYARMFASFQTAHEYAHHVQNLVGIFDAYATDRQNAGSNDAELELSRRLELQASCFGSVFWGANQPSYPITGEARRQWMFLVDHYGDEYGGGIRDHGGRINHGAWSKGGFRSESPGSCNTWSAASSKVS